MQHCVNMSDPLVIFLHASTSPHYSLYVQAWHKECFKCGDCSKRLDSTNCCEGPDKDIYCKGLLLLLSLINKFR